MDYLAILAGKEKPLPIFEEIAGVLDNIGTFPDHLEPVYRQAMGYDEERLDRLRFALLRLQIYADIHRNEDMEQAQAIKYVAQVLEKIIFGSLLMEHEELASD
ncbi:MAG: hypothetical protein LUQ25_08285 [Methanoregulaceae archaeon]|nr:hypothetical protein [Methanoregulaceae archaeon]